ncbi:LLM class flavin-dependent oxidoreductase [Streptomyces sp. NPDC060194]|uniref:LLM class flavin-dependent oxidoreductase n=1 Tax=Streptomyces sp. NPDC060194 TaxID=3347069 RepID=UPI003649064E
MELDLRGGVRAAPVAGDTPDERRALRFAPDPRDRAADPAHVVRTARENEEDGLDSALVVQSSSWPDPWLVGAWALAATTRLRVAVAHRAGVTAPTAAARSLATLDRLSGGRASAHVIVGSSDADVLRDGDTLSKAERYRRAGEYLELFRRTLDAAEPFDHSGEFYTVRDAWSGLRPAPRGELVSFGGSSPEGLALAARHAEVYAVPALPVPETRRRVAAIRRAAAGHRRTLRVWRHLTLILGHDDEDARQRASRVVRDALKLTADPHDPRWAAAVQLDRDRERGRSDPAHGAAQTVSYIRRSVAAAFVGSPDTVADRIGVLRAAGVDVLQLDLAVEDDEDRELRRALVRRLRDPHGSGGRGGW